MKNLAIVLISLIVFCQMIGELLKENKQSVFTYCFVIADCLMQ